MNEFELIERLRGFMPTNPSTRVGAGDDCAVLDLGLADRWILFKTDAVVEGVHFKADADPFWIGHKALARCLSDVAAMGGTPGHALVTLGLPVNFDPARVEGVYAGIQRLAQRHGIAIVGGETTSNPERLLVSIAVIGWVGHGRCPLRSGAEVGDALFVTGELGGSFESDRHLRFEPRLAEARWLAAQFEIHAMIDLSDGLAGDLRHVVTASGVGAEVFSDAVPIHPSIGGDSRTPSEWESGPESSPLTRAFCDGEDYELLFTLPGQDAVGLQAMWKETFPELRLSCIGRIVAGGALLVSDRQGLHPLRLDGYTHFHKS